tara:strand:- start:343 stop:1209 length:867 start_codon:yes stop_codon:yes gene_type:complete
MKKIISIIIINSFLFSIQGLIIFNDQTIIEGDINGIEKNSVYITPTGLSFPEQILVENIDSLKITDGTLPIANGKVLLLYQNGEFFKPQEPGTNKSINTPQYEIEYVIVPNWSLNLYTGYPIIRGASLQNEFYDKTNIIYGLSVGTPYGFFAGDFFMNVIGEIAYYKFEKIGNENATFGGFCLQAGVSPGFFIGNTSFSGTACTGLYRDDDQNFTLGFIAGGSVDIPLGEIILKKFPNVEIYNGLEIKDFKEYFESFEMRITGRSNLIQKKNGVTAWIGSGISFGYEF